jgi:flagellin
VFGFGTYLTGVNSEVLDTEYQATPTDATAAATLSIALPGGTPIDLTLGGTALTLAGAIDELNAQIALDSTLTSAGIVASDDGGDLQIASTNGTAFRFTILDAANNFGFGAITAATDTSTLAEAIGYLEHTFLAGGSEASTTGDVTSFTPVLVAPDAQTISITANDPTGREQSLAFTLRNDATSRAGATLDETIQEINQRLQQSNNETLQKVVAIKERNDAGTAEGIRFLSTLDEFKISVGETPNGGGINSGAQALLTSDQLAGGGVADISSKENAKRAVTLISSAITVLGRIQGDVGSGQNTLIFALSLASTQAVNFSAAESRIRDADIALEASNLTKASIRQQAGIAALAQANTAPQSVLALLQG